MSLSLSLSLAKTILNSKADASELHEKTYVFVTDIRRGGSLIMWSLSSIYTINKNMSPVCKRHGDVQWRVLHGALATSKRLVKINFQNTVLCLFCKVFED